MKIELACWLARFDKHVYANGTEPKTVAIFGLHDLSGHTLGQTIIVPVSIIQPEQIEALRTSKSVSFTIEVQPK